MEKEAGIELWRSALQGSVTGATFDWADTVLSPDSRRDLRQPQAGNTSSGGTKSSVLREIENKSKLHGGTHALK